MGYASKAGRAKTSATNPQAHAICDRCGFRYNHVNLRWQFDWRGTSLQNIKMLVCDPCYDEPQQQLRAIVVPADPVPIQNPRLQDFVTAETDYLTTSVPPTIDPTTGIPVPGGDHVITQNGQNIVMQPVGVPTGYTGNAVMPLQNNRAYAQPIPYVSIFSTGTNVVTVTCPSAHGLSTNDQISIQGLSNVNACGMFSIIVTTATTFTYSPTQIIPAGTLQQSQTKLITAIMGLPYGFVQIPQVGS